MTTPLQKAIEILDNLLQLNAGYPLKLNRHEAEVILGALRRHEFAQWMASALDPAGERNSTRQHESQQAVDETKAIWEAEKSIRENFTRDQSYTDWAKNAVRGLAKTGHLRTEQPKVRVYEAALKTIASEIIIYADGSKLQTGAAKIAHAALNVAALSADKEA